MKKLALIIILAVVASRLLSTDNGRGQTRLHARSVDDRSTVLVRTERPARPMPPEPPRKAPKARLHRLTPVSAPAQDPGPGPGLAPPVPVLPPSPMPKHLTPAWYPKSELEEEAFAKPDASGIRVLLGRISISEKRATDDLREILERQVGDWLASDVPPSWKPPAHEIDAMVLDTTVQPTTRSLKPTTVAPPASKAPAPDLEGLDEFYSFYRAGQRLDFSPSQHARFVELYHHDLAAWRMQRLGGGIILVLAALAVLSTYIKTDEATKGYYTNRLRLLALVGLGGAGAVVYRLLG